MHANTGVPLPTLHTLGAHFENEMHARSAGYIHNGGRALERIGERFMAPCCFIKRTSTHTHFSMRACCVMLDVLLLCCRVEVQVMEGNHLLERKFYLMRFREWQLLKHLQFMVINGFDLAIGV